MKKQAYVELTREQSLQRTFEICMKYATDKSQMERTWMSIPRFEQNEVEKESTSTTQLVGRESIEEEGQEVPVGL